METLLYSPTYEYSKVLPQLPLKNYGPLVEELGAGAYGTVSLHSNAKGDRFAIKTLKSDKNDYPTVDSMVELMILQRLQHPNIVPIVDFSTDLTSFTVNYFYIVMEAADSDLNTAVREKLFSEKECDYVAYQMLTATSYIHSRHIMHRDIKPENFLFKRINGVPKIWMSDFGTAKPFVCHPNNLFTNMVYTLWYRPPEVLLQDNSNYDFPADIWALGLTLYFLYNKDDLIMGDNETDQIIKIFKIFGTPTESLWPEARKMSNFDKRFPIYPGDKRYIVSNVKNKEMAIIINKMLVLDPPQRSTAYEILENPYFDSVRMNVPEKDYAPTECYTSHDTRDRHAKSYTKSTDELYKRRFISLDFLVKIVEKYKIKIKSFLWAATLLDQVTPILDFTKDEYILLCISCLSITTDLSELYPLEIKFYIETVNNKSVNENSIISMRTRIIKALGGDLLYTVPYDYADYFTHSDIRYWKLTKALMIYLPFSKLFFELSSHECFDLLLSLAIRVLNNDKTPLDARTKTFIKLIVALKDGNQQGANNYFKTITRTDINEFLDAIGPLD